MLKKLLFCLLLCWSWASFADEAAIRSAMQANYPQVRVKSISPTPYKGLYEIFTEDAQLLYTDEKMSFLLVEGKLVDPKTKRNLTDQRMFELNKVDFNALPLDKAIKVVKGNGSRKLVVFSDPDCPYCQRLEKDELSKINDVTVYVMLMPLESLHPDAANKARAIWCAPDRVKAWKDWIMDKKLAKNAGQCDNPVKSVLELAQQLNINSTPTLIFADGAKIPGAIPVSDIEKMLNGAAGAGAK